MGKLRLERSSIIIKKLKENRVLKIIRISTKRFGRDQCGNSAITISYFTVLCSIPLVALFAFVTTKILGNSELAFRSLNIFSDEFFAELDPLFFQRIQELSRSFSHLGWFGFLGSFIAASLLFSNLIRAINVIFKADYKKSFFYSRIMEYLIMFIIGIVMLLSLFITGIWTAINGTLKSSSLVADNINPEVVSLIDNFFLQYLIPFTLTFIVFFSIYKFIPEVKVHTKPALIAAVVGALIWEAFKRGFAFYVAHFSVIGVVMSRLTLQNTLTSLIFFLVWISISLYILLWGAELASVLNERKHE